MPCPVLNENTTAAAGPFVGARVPGADVLSRPQFNRISRKKPCFSNREITTGDLCAGFLCIRERVAGFVREFTATDQRERIPLVAVYRAERRKKNDFADDRRGEMGNGNDTPATACHTRGEIIRSTTNASAACTVFAIRTIACNTCNRDDG